MVIDTSAILAIFQREAECALFARAISDAPKTRLSAVNFVESATVIESRYGAKGGAWLDSFLTDTDIEVVPVDVAMARQARRTYAQFGKGRHPAGLNLADVFAYVLAKKFGEPLLFKGRDFAKTDVLAAV